MENAEFIAQMAQFPTVTGITDMGTESRVLLNSWVSFDCTAANLLGSLSQYTRDRTSGDIHGMLDLRQRLTNQSDLQ